MKLEIGKTYRGDGKDVIIDGLAKHPEIDGMTVFYSRGGDWFTSNGQFVWYSPEKGHHLREKGILRDLKEIC